MTNLINDTETTGRRLFEPIALALLAAGGLTASVARSDGGEDQPGLVVPPLTAQAHAAGSPAPEASADPLALEVPSPPVGETSQLAAELVTTKATHPPAKPGAASSNRFAEIFADADAAPASLALERPDALVAATVQAPPGADPVAAAKTAPLAEAVQLVPEAAAPTLQLVAAEPAPIASLTPAAPAPVSELVPSTPAASAVPDAKSQNQFLASAEPATTALPPTALPSNVPNEAVQLAVVPAVAALEAVARLDTPAPASNVEKSLPEAAPATKLVPQPALAVATMAPVAPPVTEISGETNKRAFVSEPMVQKIPVTAVAMPMTSALAQPAPRVTVTKTETTVRLAKAKAPRSTPLGGTISSNFQLTDGTIDYRIGARVNGGEPTSLPLRISRDDQLSVKLGDLLGLVKPQMDPALYAFLAASRGAEEYVSFATIRATGIDIRYDAARDQLLLGVE